MSVQIFLSRVSDEFRRYRDLLRCDLTRPNVEVKVQEDFKDLGGETAANVIISLVEALHGSNTEMVAQALSSEAETLCEYGRDRGSNVRLIALIAVRRKSLDSASSNNQRGCKQQLWHRGWRRSESARAGRRDLRRRSRHSMLA
jgi:hypothetical protein